MLPILLVFVPVGCANGPFAPQASGHTSTVAQANIAAIHTDPQALIRSCGRPDNSTDSVFVQAGGGGITTRSLTYSKVHLRLNYISGQGDQQWDFSSLVDTATNSTLDAGDLQKRLPCAVHPNSEIAQSADGAGQRVGKSARQRAGKATPDS